MSMINILTPAGFDFSDHIGDQVRLSYCKGAEAELTAYAGTIVKPTKNKPGHLTIQQEDGKYKSFQPGRIIHLVITN